MDARVITQELLFFHHKFDSLRELSMRLSHGPPGFLRAAENVWKEIQLFYQRLFEASEYQFYFSTVPTAHNWQNCTWSTFQEKEPPRQTLLSAITDSEARDNWVMPRLFSLPRLFLKSHLDNSLGSIGGYMIWGRARGRMDFCLPSKSCLYSSSDSFFFCVSQ